MLKKEKIIHLIMIFSLDIIDGACHNACISNFSLADEWVIAVFSIPLQEIVLINEFVMDQVPMICLLFWFFAIKRILLK